MNKFAKEAPVIVIVLAEPDLVSNGIGKAVQGVLYYLLDIGASIEHFLLQAAEVGLGTCWLGWYSEDRIKKELNIPKAKKIVSVFCLGYPADQPGKKTRKSIEEISFFNSYKP